LSETPDTPALRAARAQAARLARAAVAGEIGPDEARSQWPLQEDIDPSVDALAHIYFDHYVWTAKRRQPDEYDAASVLEIADLIGDGDPLDDDRLRGFEGITILSFDGRHIVAAIAVVSVVVYLLVRFL